MNDEVKQMCEQLIEKSRVIIHLKNSEKILAQATLDLGSIEIRNWTIQESQFESGYLIQPPRALVGKFWLFHVYVGDKNLYKKITDKIAYSYEQELLNKQTEEAVEDIPF
jgi:hypothetical protein